jgi:hypothetical protein
LKILKSRNSKIKFTYENIIKLIILGITYIKGLNLDDTQLNTIYNNVIPSLEKIKKNLNNKLSQIIQQDLQNVMANTIVIKPVVSVSKVGNSVARGLS